MLTAALPLLLFCQTGLFLIQLLPNAILIMIMVIVLGILASLARYFIYHYPSFSKKRAGFSLVNSSSLLLYFALFSLLTSLETKVQTSIISISFRSMFILLALPWIVFLIRDIYNLVDFSLHEDTYILAARKQKYDLKSLKRCSRCGYKMKIGLKRCPRCQTPQKDN